MDARSRANGRRGEQRAASTAGWLLQEWKAEVGGSTPPLACPWPPRSTRGNVWWIWYFRLVLCSSAGRFKADGQRITAPELSNMNNDDALIFRATGLFRQSAEVIWIAR